MFDYFEFYWMECFFVDQVVGVFVVDVVKWYCWMCDYVVVGCVYDFEENEDQICCVVVFVCDVVGVIVGVISVLSVV